MRTPPWTFLLAAALSWCGVASASSAAAPERAAAGAPSPAQNILLIISDDHGPDLGAYGNPVIRTPHLDALAADGVRFTNAFATTASCSASRSVILTGLHNHRTGQYGHTHDYHHFASYDHVRSLPNLLGEAGYRTAIIGKLHVAPASAFAFETVLPGAGRNDVEMAERTREFLTADDERPFFLYFAPHDPHRGGKYLADGTQAPIEDKKTADDFGNRGQGYPGVKNVSFSPDEVIVPGFLPDNAAARAELVEYYRAVSRLDQGVGRLLGILREAGHYDDTLTCTCPTTGSPSPGRRPPCTSPGSARR